MNRDGDTVDRRELAEKGIVDPDGESSIQTLQELENRLNALSPQLATLRGSLEQAQTERAELREEVEHLQSENERLQQETEQLDARTNLLELVEKTDTLDGKQRSIALIQHLKRAAEREHQRDQMARASINRQEAEAALHHPNVDRTTIYDDMHRAVRLVGNENVLWYEGSSGGESRLKLDLETGDLPADIIGQQTDHARR